MYSGRCDVYGFVDPNDGFFPVNGLKLLQLVRKIVEGGEVDLEKAQSFGPFATLEFLQALEDGNFILGEEVDELPVDSIRLLDLTRVVGEAVPCRASRS